MPNALTSSLLRRHLRRVFLIIYRVVGDSEIAQDLTQQTFIAVLQPSSSAPASLTTQGATFRLTKAVVEQIRKYLLEGSSQTGEQLAGSSLRLNTVAPPDSRLLDSRSLRLERRLGLDGGLAELTKTERLIMLLRDVESVPAAQIARQLNCSKSTILSQLARARLKFMAYLVSRH